ncbi:MAG TPA: hypothetical protein IAA58_00635 [Candidatus Gallacutalibacter stercoravium]|nr:hypothetical protein [Candidatus Gallacutalibacter stercoravium]
MEQSSRVWLNSPARDVFLLFSAWQGPLQITAFNVAGSGRQCCASLHAGFKNFRDPGTKTADKVRNNNGVLSALFKER